MSAASTISRLRPAKVAHGSTRPPAHSPVRVGQQHMRVKVLQYPPRSSSTLAASVDLILFCECGTRATTATTSHAGASRWRTSQLRGASVTRYCLG
eukprot:837702-Pyramimonas_sp.AAC.1